jgi:membrane protein implicated in regulation of membrane protease activity
MMTLVFALSTGLLLLALVVAYLTRRVADEVANNGALQRAITANGGRLGEALQRLEEARTMAHHYRWRHIRRGGEPMADEPEWLREDPR